MQKHRMQALQPGKNATAFQRAATLFCIFMLSLVVFVQVAHVHPLDSNPDQCPLCVVMHSAAPVATVAAVVVVTHASTPIAPVVLVPVTRLWHYTLYNRPPPTVA